MARAAAKLERELSRLEEIRDRFAGEEADANRDKASHSADLVGALATDDIARQDEIEAAIKAAEAKHATAARRRASVMQAIVLMKDELEAVRIGDRIRAARRRFEAGEVHFSSGKQDLSDAIKQACLALGTMHAAYTDAAQAADELRELGEERPGLYAFDVKWGGVALQQVREEAVNAALVAAQASSPAFTWDFRIGAAVPTAS